MSLTRDYGIGFDELGVYTIDEDIQKRERKKIVSLHSKYLKKLEDVKQEFFSELEKNGYENYMGMIKKREGEDG